MSEKSAFDMQYTPSVPGILKEIGGAMAITTYQANRLIFLYSDGEKVIQIPKLMKKPMGIAVKDDLLAVATMHSVEVYQNSADLGELYPEAPGRFGSMLVPRASYYSGALDLHDIQFGANNEIFAVNTRFSTVCVINHLNSFRPIWKPPFVTKILPEDRCHLNGLVMLKGIPKLVSCLGKTDTPRGWKDNVASGGLLIDMETNETIIDNVPMPHSPRLKDGKLYLLLSAIGGLLIIDLQTGKEEAYDLHNFVRGMAIVGKYLVIGTSRIRENSKSFENLPVREAKNQSGLIFFNTETRKVEGKIVYSGAVEEIYDVAHVPFFNNSFMLTKEDDIHNLSIIINEIGVWLKPSNKND